jgi:hypothetical protein
LKKEDFMRNAIYGSLMAAAVGTLSCGSPSVETNGKGGGSSGQSTPGGAGSSGTGGPMVVLPEPGNTTPPPSNMPTEMMNCGLKKHDLERRPADLLLVLDRSGSMVDPVTVNGMPVPKWGEVIAALDQVIKRTEPSVFWGLKLYPMGADSCGVPDGAEVGNALNNHAMVMGLANMNAPVSNGGSTPTQAAVRKATAALMASPSPNNKFILLATDGEPNCGMGFGGRGRSDAMGSIAAVADAQTAGISTFVVGVATAGSDAHETLNQMADKGGRPRADPAARYYPVTSRDELVATLEAIATQVGSCTFPLSPPPPAPGNVAVDVDGMRVQKDPASTDGWSYGANNNSIVIHGPTCERLKNGTAKNVQIIYGCGTTVIP